LKAQLFGVYVQDSKGANPHFLRMWSYL
jgi:hypothetical protein